MGFPALCPIADRQEWLPQRNIGGGMTTSRGLVLHVNAGNGDPYNWWTRPTTPIASSHFQLMKDGTLIQYVRLDTVAWCQVAGSETWHSIETEGFPSEALTDVAVAKLAKLYAWGHKNLGWPLQIADTPAQTGFGWHGMGGWAWGGHFGCPGDLRKAQRAKILQLASEGDDPFMSMPTVDCTKPLDMAHPDVRTIQGLLAARGGWINPTNTDHKTLNAVLEWFQTGAGLQPDRVVGPATWNALAKPKGSNAK